MEQKKAGSVYIFPCHKIRCLCSYFIRKIVLFSHLLSSSLILSSGNMKHNIFYRPVPSYVKISSPFVEIYKKRLWNTVFCPKVICFRQIYSIIFTVNSFPVCRISIVPLYFSTASFTLFNPIPCRLFSCFLVVIPPL